MILHIPNIELDSLGRPIKDPDTGLIKIKGPSTIIDTNQCLATDNKGCFDEYNNIISRVNGNIVYAYCCGRLKSKFDPSLNYYKYTYNPQ